MVFQLQQKAQVEHREEGFHSGTLFCCELFRLIDIVKVAATTGPVGPMTVKAGGW